MRMRNLCLFLILGVVGCSIGCPSTSPTMECRSHLSTLGTGDTRNVHSTKTSTGEEERLFVVAEDFQLQGRGTVKGLILDSLNHGIVNCFDCVKNLCKLITWSSFPFDAILCDSSGEHTIPGRAESLYEGVVRVQFDIQLLSQLVEVCKFCKNVPVRSPVYDGSMDTLWQSVGIIPFAQVFDVSCGKNLCVILKNLEVIGVGQLDTSSCSENEPEFISYLKSDVMEFETQSFKKAKSANQLSTNNLCSGDQKNCGINHQITRNLTIPRIGSMGTPSCSGNMRKFGPSITPRQLPFMPDSEPKNVPPYGMMNNPLPQRPVPQGQNTLPQRPVPRPRPGSTTPIDKNFTILFNRKN